MPSATKATFSLDAASLEKLNKLSRRWQVSKTEVLRRALTKADQNDMLAPEERIAALHELQRWAKDAKIDFKQWKRTIKDARPLHELQRWAKDAKIDFKQWKRTIKDARR